MEKTVNKTSALLQKIFHTQDIENFIKRNSTDLEIPAFHVYVLNLCKKSNRVPEQVILRSGIERTYGHQLFNGTRKPSRDKVIQLAFGFELDVDGTQELLRIAQKSSLYPKIKRDAAILHCLNHHKDLLETQAVLHSLELTLLGGEKL